MIKHKSILIKNIYYMLSFAFQSLSKICDDYVEAEEFDNIQDLFSVILAKGISNQVKRGLNREYEYKSENLSALRGKINISASIKQSTITQSKLTCEFDEFTENSYLNQILKSTCNLLIFKGDIKHENRGQLKKLMLYFSNVDELDLKRIHWNSISYHRNNSTYKMLINLCYLIIKGLLITTEKGEQKLGKYLDDGHMHKLYEKFVLEYYRKYYPQLKPNPSQIKWVVETDCSIEFLPSMNSDIMLTGNGKTLIIDTKFYSKSMQTNYDKKSIISNNLYQIFTYVKNQDKDNSGTVSGLLLYAKTDEDITPDCEYKMGGNDINVKTLDLNQEWGEIQNKLNSFIVSLV